MTRSFARRLAFLASLAFNVGVAACTTGGGGQSGDDDDDAVGDDDDDGGSDVGAPTGGFVWLDFWPELFGTVYVRGEFYTAVENSSATPILRMDAEFFAVPRESCYRFTGAEVAPVLGYDDVGAQIHLAGADFNRNLNRFINGAVIDYLSVTNALDADPGTTMDVLVDGSGAVPAQTWPGALSLPPAPVLLTSSFDLTAGGAWDVTWTPTGGEEFVVTFYPDAGPGAYCRVEDDGIFTVPADVIDGLQAGGIVRFRNLDHAPATLLDRELLFVGSVKLERYYDR